MTECSVTHHGEKTKKPALPRPERRDPAFVPYDLRCVVALVGSGLLAANVLSPVLVSLLIIGAMIAIDFGSAARRSRRPLSVLLHEAFEIALGSLYLAKSEAARSRKAGEILGAVGALAPSKRLLEGPGDDFDKAVIALNELAAECSAVAVK